MRSNHGDAKRSMDQRIVLVLQGGGALGAYQAGVYQALHEHGLTPDWIIGTSIGAINAALIAGNAQTQRVARLQEFWDTVAHADVFDMRKMSEQGRRMNAWLASLDAFVWGVPGFFAPRLGNPFALGLPAAPGLASFYDTGPLANTLANLVDVQALNADDGIRLTVSALKVATGELVHFDNRRQPLALAHIIASGALPPGFAPVRIGDDWYWDGGVYSNTPLEVLLDEAPRVDTLCFMVDLWSKHGPLPTTLQQVMTRQKDVAYASRSKQHIGDYMQMHRLRCALRELYERLPLTQQSDEERQALSDLGCDTTIHVVRLAYAGRDWHMASKDVNFSQGSIRWRWEQGYRDTMRASEHHNWMTFQPVPAGLMIHEIVPDARETVVRK